MRPPPEESRNRWISGVCLGPVGPRSYEIQTKDGIYRRNRQMIRESSDTRPTANADHTGITSELEDTSSSSSAHSQSPPESSASEASSDPTDIIIDESQR